MIGHDSAMSTAENYRRFATLEARGRSPLYEEWASAVADDPDVLAFLDRLPLNKRQPNLLFAAVRLLSGVPDGYAAFREVVLDRGGRLEQTMLARRTQTNEPARCATLLPALAALPQPLALLEVGASAGLTLLPDRYGYDFAGHRIDPPTPDAPILRCQPQGFVPLPASLPHVVWRAGIDLNPLDVTDEDDVAWLRCLIWPGQAEREERLGAAVTVARRDPPRLVRGDLIDQLPALAAEAPQGATLVVFHSAVLAYIEESRRREFAAAVRQLDGVWLSNEAPDVLPGVSTRLPPTTRPSPFVLVRGGDTALALTDPHGSWVDWLSHQRDGSPSTPPSRSTRAANTASGSVNVSGPY